MRQPLSQLFDTLHDALEGREPTDANVTSALRSLKLTDPDAYNGLCSEAGARFADQKPLTEVFREWHNFAKGNEGSRFFAGQQYNVGVQDDPWAAREEREAIAARKERG